MAGDEIVSPPAGGSVGEEGGAAAWPDFRLLLWVVDSFGGSTGRSWAPPARIRIVPNTLMGLPVAAGRSAVVGPPIRLGDLGGTEDVPSKFAVKAVRLGRGGDPEESGSGVWIGKAIEEYLGRFGCEEETSNGRRLLVLKDK